jgi:UDP-xylose/UDP-N-acetylglucosamine transporter B4
MAKKKNIIITLPRIFFKEWLLVSVLIFGGCCSNVFSLEVLVQSQPKSGHLVTFAQFLLVAIEGFFAHLERPLVAKGKNSSLALKKSQVPLSHWWVLVILFWISSVLNNYALSFSISMPFHIIFRSAGLIVTLLISYCFFGQSYSSKQVFAVLLVSLGILLTTFASAFQSGKLNTLHSSSNVTFNSEWFIGVGLLIIALIISAFMGQYQQMLYTKYGHQHWKEGLFYMHALSLPAFLFVYKSIYEEFVQYSTSEPMFPLAFLSDTSPLSFFSLPRLWFYLIINVLTQCKVFFKTIILKIC